MKTKTGKKTDLGNDPVGKLLFKLAVPAITAQIVNVLYNLVDRMYIGHIPEIGATALTGVGVSFPLIMVVSAFAALMAMGGATKAAIMLGRKDSWQLHNRHICGRYITDHYSVSVWTGPVNDVWGK